MAKHDTAAMNKELPTASARAAVTLVETMPFPPPISVSTTFEVAEVPFDQQNIYSRVTSPTRNRLEKLLASLESSGDGKEAHAVTYASGLAAIFAALVHFKPKRVAIYKGYHGSHDVLKVFENIGALANVIELNLKQQFQPGDLLWVESPLNPTAELMNIKSYVQLAKQAGAMVVVDSTFAPPPLQHCLRFGVDMVMHSATKFLGGHSDMLMGVLIVRTPEEKLSLIHERIAVGAVPGSMETWLLLRSLRTLSLRVKRQSDTANEIANRLASALNGKQNYFSPVEVDGIKFSIEEVFYPGVNMNEKDMQWQLEQMPQGFRGVLSIQIRSADYVHRLLSRLKLWKNATSLGGVESLIDHRYRWDKTIHEGLCRLSCGLEDPRDLLNDLVNAFCRIAED